MADWTHVQGGADVTTADSSITISAVGNNSVVCIGCVIDTGRSVTLTDNAGAGVNVYDPFPNDDDGTFAVYTFKPRNGVIAGNPTVFTFNSPGGTPGTFAKVVDEFALPTGKSTISFDGGQVALNNSGTFTGLAATDTPVFQNLQSDALIWGFGVVVAANTITTGAGFTTGTTLSSGGLTILSEWKIQAAPTTSNKLNFATQTGTMWAGVMAIAPVARSTWTPIQSARQFPPGASAANFSVSFPKPTTAGSIIVGEFFPNSGSFAELQTFIDDKNNNYLPNCLTPRPVGRSLFWSGGQLTTTPQTLSGTLSPSDAVGLFFTEFMPPPNTISVAIDGGGAVGTNTGNPGSPTTVTSPSITTTVNNDLIYSSVEPAGAPGCVPLNGITVTNGLARPLANGYIIQPAFGPIAATWDIAAGVTNLTMFEVAFSATIAPATNPVFARYGAAHGIGALSAIPGEIPS